VVLILAGFAVAAIVLTAAAWWLSRKLDQPSADSRLDGTDQVDRWLIQHYGLMTSGECIEVRDAVYEGRAVGHPALRTAARGLALEVLGGRQRDRVPGLYVVGGLHVFAGAATAVTSTVHGGARSTVGLVGGIGWLLAGLSWMWRARPPRRRAESAAVRNDGSLGAVKR
jgi:hypothetical protein